MSIPFLQEQTPSQPHTDSIWATQWAANDTVFSAAADGQIVQWDATKAEPLHTQPPHTLGLVSLSVSESGDLALYNTIEGITCLWDTSSGHTVRKHESFLRTGSGATEPAWSVSIHPKGSVYAATGGSGNITLHSCAPDSFGSVEKTLSPGRAKFGMFVAFSPDGSRVAYSTESGQIYIFDCEAGALAATYSSHAMCVRGFAWSLDSQLLLSASDDKRLVLHDVRSSSSGKPGSGAVASLNGHTSWVLSATFSPDGRLAASGSADKTVRVWDIAARTPVSTIQEQGEVWSVSWRPRPGIGPGMFVAGTEDGMVKWWRGAGSA
ncbi:WD repeat-containing protein 61 [Exidia glandulosa HHB12029]|uniref:WD repeat-containing protein 61 n=1 Tax=Exidia glandulosa HHB12029 TaxID=1314781 RepID=A0A165PQV7_EXIGL|nr:WD repeat-containing protein 61 [Exidia glandulosa HHB12029]